MWGNVLAGGLIVWGVDATSGAQYTLSPDTIYVTLRPVGGSNAARREKADKITNGIAKLRTLDQALEAGTLSEEEYSKARQRIVEK